MKRNAFTLVELLAVIVILSVVSLIAVPQLFNAIKSNNVDSYNGIVKNIILAAESYANNHNGILVQMPVAKLQEEGYLPSNLKNPVNNNTMNGCVYAIDGDTYYKEETCSVYITHLNPSMIVAPTTCEYTNGYVWNFEYTGDVQDFTVPCNGTYKVEAWGAGAGISTSASFRSPGQGGYTKGDINLNKNSNIYLYVGGMSGYNSGAMGASNGGGATDVRYFENTPSTNDLIWNSNSGLNSRIMVAAGGGGGFVGEDTVKAIGHAGGLIGYAASTQSHNQYSGTGGSQVSGGAGGTNYCHTDWAPCDFSNKNGSFGPGGYVTIRDGNTYHSSGGGGGYYGGGVGPHWGAGTPGGGGGSSYISGHAGCLAIDRESILNPRALKSGCTSSSTSVDCSTHYSGLKFTDTVMIDGAGYNWTTTKGSQVGMPKHDGTEGTMNGNSGNGYARITLVSSGDNNVLITFNANGGTLTESTRNVLKNTTIGELPIPILENHTFIGWYLDSNFTNKVDETYVVDGDITLYAKYIEKKTVFDGTFKNGYTLTYVPETNAATPVYRYAGVEGSVIRVTSSYASVLGVIYNVDITDYSKIHIRARHNGSVSGSYSYTFGISALETVGDFYEKHSKGYARALSITSSTYTDYYLDISEFTGNYAIIGDVWVNNSPYWQATTQFSIYIDKIELE